MLSVMSLDPAMPTCSSACHQGVAQRDTHADILCTFPTGARIERAASAICGLELRLNKQLELLDG